LAYLHLRVVEATGLPLCYSYFKAHFINSKNTEPICWPGKVTSDHETTDPLWNQSHTFKLGKNDLETGFLMIEVFRKHDKSEKDAGVCLGECRFDLKHLSNKDKDKDKDKEKESQFHGWLPIRYRHIKKENFYIPQTILTISKPIHIIQKRKKWKNKQVIQKNLR